MAQSSIHWLAPASATGALIAALLLSAGHHLFYRSLHGSPVSDEARFAFEISRQQINIAVGTAFAFLAKASMVAAISITFVQLFWYTAQARSAEAVPTLERVDALYAVLDNAFEMFNFRSWLLNPLLMIVAGVAWLVPIASVITPATLSVRTARVFPAPVSSVQVPNLDFRSTSYLAQMPSAWVPRAENYTGPQPFYFEYERPSDDLLRLTNAVTSNGNIMPLEPPGMNASWQLEFHGPSLNCSLVEDAVQVNFRNDLAEYLRNSENGGALQQYGYVAWYPIIDGGRIRVPAAVNGSGAPSLSVYSDSAVIDVGSLVPAATVATLNRHSTPLEIMVLTQPFQQDVPLDSRTDSSSKIRSCQLYNATYRVDFDYTSGSQMVSHSVTRHLSEGPVQHIPGVLYKYVNAATDFEGYPCLKPDSKDLRCCYNHRELLPTLAYQAVMDAFGQSLQGVIYMDGLKSDGVWIGSATSFYADTNLMQTRLADSDDLAYLRTAMQSTPEDTGALTFQDAIQANGSSAFAPGNHSAMDFTGTYRTSTTHTDPEKPLEVLIEELFANLTISLMSSGALQPNYSSPTAPSPATVTFHRYHNIYVYSSQKLWLSYGIALALTALALVAGLIAMRLNQASYSNNFSTILRAAHGAQLSTKISDEDAHGQDPLPKYLATAKLWLHGAGPRGGVEHSVGTLEPAQEARKGAMSTVRLLNESASAHSSSRSRSGRLI